MDKLIYLYKSNIKKEAYEIKNRQMDEGTYTCHESWVVISLYCECVAIDVTIKIVTNSPLKGQKLKCMCRIVAFTGTHIADVCFDMFFTILFLVKSSPQTIATCTYVNHKGFGIICIC